jgi:hypothetical protein
MLEETQRPAIATAPISVVLALQSRTDALQDIVGEWVGYLQGLEREYEVLVVDDSGAVEAPPLPSGVPAVRMVRHPQRQGLGGILRTGLQATRFPLFFYTLANGRYVAADLDRLLKTRVKGISPAIDRADLAVGHRRIPFRQRQHRLARAAYRMLLRLLFGLRVRDPGCHYLLARRTMFRRIPIQSEGEFAHVEILAKANFLGFMMIDDVVQYRADSDVSPSPWRRDLLAELRQVFSRPDFGPAVLPPADEAGSTIPENRCHPPPPRP